MGVIETRFESLLISFTPSYTLRWKTLGSSLEVVL